jgi:hypothetical protein
MASGTVAPQTTSEGPPLAPTRYATFIEGRIHYTRRQVKTVDIATTLMVLAASTLAFLLAVAVLDQWVVHGGLPFSARLLLWLAGLAAVGAYFWRQVLPPLVHRVNPIYAAQTIEQNRPSLKNSLINFLLLRSHREEVLPVVYRALEQRAAVDLSQTNIEAAVDRGRVVRRACLLAGIVVAFALYLALSPKNPLSSAARVLWPWSRIPAPTRVTIDDLRPGDTTAFFGDSVDVSALVGGLRDGEPVTLLASTADGQSVDQPIPMSPVGEGNRFQCKLPPGDLGLQQDILYRLVAGDCNTPQFRIEVQIAPSILVDRVDYHFPPYTGQKDRTVLGQGDLRAIEGTRITLHATANQDIREAKIDLNCAGLRSLAMQSDGQTATGQFTLGFASDGRPEFDSYQILFSDSQGRTNRRPVRYQVEVIRDLPPEVQILSPKEEEVSVPLDGRLAIGVRAEDDFALRRVAVAAEREGRRLPIPPLLSREKPQQPWQGVFQKEYVFQPAALGLKAGDRIKYWAEADDNKELKPNHVETSPRTLHVTAPETPQPAAAGAVPHRAPPRTQDGANPRQNPQDSTSEPPKPDQGTADQPPESPSEKPPPSAEPKPQRDETTSPESTKPDASQGPNDAKQNEPATGSPAGPSTSGDNGENETAQPASSESQEPQRVDPKTQQGDAFQKISKDLEKEKQGEKGQQGGSSGSAGASGEKGGSAGSQKPSPNGSGSAGASGDSGTSAGSQKAGPSKSGSAGASGDNGTSAGSQKPDTSKSGNAGKPGEEVSSAGAQKPDPSKSGSAGASGDNGTSAGSQKPDTSKSGSAGASGDSGTSAGSRKPDTSKSGSAGKPGEEVSSAGAQKPDTSKSGNAGKPGEEVSSAGAQKPDTSKSGSAGKPGEEVSSAGAQKPDVMKPGTLGEAASKGGSAKVQETGKKPESGDQSAGKEPGTQKPGDEEQSNGGRSSPQKAGSKPGGASKGGMDDASPRQQAPSSKSGNGAKGDQGPPSPHGEKLPGEQKTADGSPNPQPSENDAQSPTTSPKESSTKGNPDGGDRSAQGGKGGEQPGKKPGKGTPGANTPAEEGGLTASKKGPGETGNRAGDDVQAKGATGSTKQEAGAGKGRRRDEPGKESAAGEPKAPREGPSDAQNARDESSAAERAASTAGDKASDQPGGHGGGQPVTGGRPGQLDDVAAHPSAPDRGADAANLEFTRKQVDLLLEHLANESAKEKSGLLKELGWSRDEAQRFLENWRKMEAAAQESGAKGDAGRRSLDEALRNLGLRPHGTRLKGGRTTTDQIQNLRDAGQFDPPSEWQDAVGAYSRTLAGQRGGEK